MANKQVRDLPVSRMVPVQEHVCPACKIKMQLFAINFEESIYLCPTEGCFYPLNQSHKIVLVASNNMCSDNEMVSAYPEEKALDVISADTEQNNSGSSVTEDGVAHEEPAVADISDSNNALMNLPKSMESIIRKVALANKNFTSLLPKNFLESLSPPSVSSSSSLVAPAAAAVAASSSSSLSLLPSSPLPSLKKTLKRKIVDVKNNSSTVTASLPPHLQQRKLNVNVAPNKQVHYLQWPNSQALCWLDVILCLFVHNKMLKARVRQLPPQDRSVLKTLFKAYTQAMKLFNGTNQPEKGQPTAKGPNSSIPASDLPMAILKKAMLDNSVAVKGPKKKAVKLLLNVREAVWKQLQTKLLCKKGTNDGPVFALISLEKQEPALRDVFTMDYILEFLCKQCEHRVTSSHTKMLPTLEAAADFSMYNMQHIVKCSNCNCRNQCRTLKPIKFGNSILLHFLKGIPFEDLSKLNFTHNSIHYHVVGIVQYTNDPDHFIAWIKYSDRKWIKCDDLDGPICSVNLGLPLIPKQEIHLVMWEKLKSDSLETVADPKTNSASALTNPQMLPVVTSVSEAPSASALPVVTISDDSCSSPIPSTSSVTLSTTATSMTNSIISSTVGTVFSRTTPSTGVSVLGNIMSSIEAPVFGDAMSSTVVPVLSGTIPSAVVPVLSGTIPSAVMPVLSATVPSTVVSVIGNTVTSAVTPALNSTVSQLVSPALCSTMSQPVISALCSTVSPLVTAGLCNTVSPLVTPALYSTVSPSVTPAICSTVSSQVAPTVNTTESSAALSTVSPTVAPVHNIMLSSLGTPISCATLLSVANPAINGPISISVTPTSTTQPQPSSSADDSFIIPMSVSPSGLISLSTTTSPSEVVFSLPVMSSTPNTLLTQLVSSGKEESSSSLTSASPILKSALLNSSPLLASETLVSAAGDSIPPHNSASLPTQVLSNSSETQSCLTGSLTPATSSNQVIYPVQIEPPLSMNTACVVQNTPVVVRPGQSGDLNQVVIPNCSQIPCSPMEVKQISFQPLPISKGNTKTLPIKLESDANHLNKLKANLAMVKRFRKW
ncbi:SUMO-specific isopeptidase USPL1-like isoform X1 [Octopus sinensis]|uniref:SUMO-specific isopeptidase USPL1-like isoform X1 n=2 Tax=Octopus sinensis TaxID=2607531 RepID=A0A7E6EV94_9MOLL|nr:SUMO-specific isopeptidase USPL1-like isoform X1 [Octopus sinensis]